MNSTLPLNRANSLEYALLGLDLGTKHPARAVVAFGGRKPCLIGSSRGNFSKLDTRCRAEASLTWIHGELQLAWTQNLRRVAVEDPRNTSTQLLKRGHNGTRSLMLLLHQFAQVDTLARSIGFQVVTVEPRTVVARLGLKLTPKASTAQRRREKKAQTKRWVELCVDNAKGLTEDECDAIAVAYAGRALLRGNQ